MAKHINYDFEPYDGDPAGWHKFKERLFGAGANHTDDSGSSLTDYFQGIDMGGPQPGAPALAVVVAIAGNAGAAAAALAGDAQKMARLRSKRHKNAYALLTKHLTNEDMKSVLHQQFSQDGYGAYQYVEGMCDRGITPIMLDQMNSEWNDLSITSEVGIDENSIQLFVQVMDMKNGKRPFGQRFNETQRAEKLLRAIFMASKHFHEGAITEFNAPAGSRRFEHPAPAALPALPVGFVLPPHLALQYVAVRHRNLVALTAHYNGQWRDAVKAGILTKAAPTKRAAGSGRHSVEHAFSACMPSEVTLDPASALEALESAGLHCAKGCCTTTAFDQVPARSLAMAVMDQCDECCIEVCHDANETPSVELICFNCGGVAHIASKCPSPKKRRSFDYIITLLQQHKVRSEQRASGRSAVGARKPQRGQSTPFRPVRQPVRFQASEAASARAATEAHSEDDGAETEVAGSGVEKIEQIVELQTSNFLDDDYFEADAGMLHREEPAVEVVQAAAEKERVTLGVVDEAHLSAEPARLCSAFASALDKCFGSGRMGASVTAYSA